MVQRRDLLKQIQLQNTSAASQKDNNPAKVNLKYCRAFPTLSGYHIKDTLKASDDFKNKQQKCMK